VAVIQPVTRMFYAYGDTRSPVIASALNLLVFLGLSQFRATESFALFLRS
jgi:peptidoglycan biosynthesis protein MviN/MurJ (putative lipid II flippase)